MVEYSGDSVRTKDGAPVPTCNTPSALAALYANSGI